MVEDNKNEEFLEEDELVNTDESILDIEEDFIEEEENLVEEASDLEAENAKLKNDMLRILADTENTKKRLVAEAEKNAKYAISSFAKSLLAVADNLQRAMASAEEGPLLDGVKLTYEELLKVFNKEHISQMDCLDKPFDPNFHQVISEVVDETKDAGTVIQVLQTGYLISDRILREAMVVVSKK
ncbi:MAG: nucleotide exchange factor GrpE [Alphaproteobacteria bacterium]